MSPQVVVVIANWNGCHLLADCWRALELQSFSDFETVIVDNGSSDGSVDWLQANAPTAAVIRNEFNRGFAAANNQGIRASTAPLIVTLNNDARPHPDWLQALVQAAEQAKEFGMFASKILLQDSIGQFDSAGIEVDRAGIAWNRLWKQSHLADANQPIEVFGPSAAAALYRRSMLDQIGLFDEDLFAYYEDVDLAWRAHWAGWRCQYVPQAVVEHAHSATSGLHSPFKSYYLGRNKWRVIAKNYPFEQLRRYVPIMALLDLVALCGSAWQSRSLDALRGRWVARREWRQVQRLPSSARAIDWYQLLVPIRLARFISG
jgi:hypothetical protein